ESEAVAFVQRDVRGVARLQVGRPPLGVDTSEVVRQQSEAVPLAALLRNGGQQTQVVVRHSARVRFLEQLEETHDASRSSGAEQVDDERLQLVLLLWGQLLALGRNPYARGSVARGQP